jgi:hypothetical protein
MKRQNQHAPLTDTECTFRCITWAWMALWTHTVSVLFCNWCNENLERQMSHLAPISKNVTLNLIFHCLCRKIVYKCNNFAGTFGVSEGKCKTSLDWPPDGVSKKTT